MTLATSRVATERSRDSIAWPTADSRSPASSYHWAARRCSAGTRSGRVRPSSRRSAPANNWCWWYQAPPCRRRGTGWPARAPRGGHRIRSPHDGVAQRTAHPGQDRDPQHELLDVRLEQRQHVIGQVVDDRAVAAGERVDERAPIVVGDEQRQQPERGRPPAGALGQPALVVGESPSTPMPSRNNVSSRWSKRRSSARTSSRSPDARSRAIPSAGSARVETTSWTRAGRYRMNASTRASTPSAPRQVQVVQDEHEVRPLIAQLVEQQRERVLLDLVRSLAQGSQRLRTRARLDERQRGDQVQPQPGRVGVPPVEGHPRHRHRGVRRHPLGQQRGFSVPAGAETRVNARPRPSRSRCTSAGRAIAPLGSLLGDILLRITPATAGAAGRPWECRSARATSLPDRLRTILRRREQVAGHPVPTSAARLDPVRLAQAGPRGIIRRG